MKLKIKLLAQTVPGRRHFYDLTRKADHIIQSRGFQQDALQRLASSQPRQAVGFGHPQHHQAMVEA